MTATSTFDIPYLRDFYDRTLTHAAREGEDTWASDGALLAGLRLNVLETSRYLNTERPTFEAFEDWILHRNSSNLDEKKIDRLRRALAGETVGPEVPLDHVEGLSEEDLAHWDEHGYVIVRHAVTPEAAEAAELAIYDHLNMDRDDPDTWYSKTLGHTIWVPLLRHPTLDANRQSPRLHKAFAQLWQREDLWTTIDQGGLNPPERPGWGFPARTSTGTPPSPSRITSTSAAYSTSLT